MKTLFSILVSVVVCVLAAGQVPAKDVKPVGTYNFILSDSATSGPCPMGKNGRGKLSIVKAGRGYQVRYLTGMVCRPAAVCRLFGNCTGDTCRFSTRVKVDNEGGTITNTAQLKFLAKHAMGSGKSVYRHPGGMVCTWTYLLTLTR